MNKYLSPEFGTVIPWAGSRVSFGQSDCTVSPRAGSRISKGDCTLIDSLGSDVHDLYLIITIPEPPQPLPPQALLLPPPPLPVFAAPGVARK
jgi:hypothetical protein